MPQERSVNVERIFISPARGVAQLERETISVKGGMGIVGDRNFGKAVHPGQNLTLIEAEEIELFCEAHFLNRDLSLLRRNLVTRGVKLNSLLNVEFTISGVRLRGVELCEPCVLVGNSLSGESLSPAEVIKHWLHRGGLRADVLSDGYVVRGARIEIGA